MSGVRASTHAVELRPCVRPLRSAVAELWAHRELVYFLAWRDVRVRYKQATLGVAWAVLRPLLLMAVFSLVFSRIKGIDTDSVPYAVFAFAGLTLWLYFTAALLSASDSLVSSANLVSKTWFPRLALPLASLLAALPDLVVSVVALGVLLVITGTPVGWPLLAFPLVLVALVLVTASIGIGLAALNVSFRDVKHVVPFITQVGMWVTPVAYPTNLLPARFQDLLAVNPMAGVIDAARWSLLGADAPDLSRLLTSSAVAVVLLVVSLRYFRRTEHTFADVI